VTLTPPKVKSLPSWGKRGAMHLPKFDYFAPRTIEEACSLLSKYREEARVIAGGTDLLAKMKNRRLLPSYLISLKHIPDLDYIRYDEKRGLRIGALATIESIKTSATIRRKFGILAQAAGLMGSVAIRNQGTIGGNLCNAAPSAETAPALISLGTKAKIVGLSGERTITLEDFFAGPGVTVLQADEILTEVQIVNLPPRSGGVYLKHSLRKMDIALVGVGVVVTLDGESCTGIKIALGAVAPTPIRARKAESVIRGQVPDEGLMEKAAQIASAESHPIDDIRSRAEYRRQILSILTKQGIEQATKQAKLGSW
jgi:CO/xanthine dehydrogenase FAD-binding subunit